MSPGPLPDSRDMTGANGTQPQGRILGGLDQRHLEECQRNPKAGLHPGAIISHPLVVEVGVFGVGTRRQ